MRPLRRSGSEAGSKPMNGMALARSLKARQWSGSGLKISTTLSMDGRSFRSSRTHPMCCSIVPLYAGGPTNPLKRLPGVKQSISTINAGSVQLTGVRTTRRSIWRRSRSSRLKELGSIISMPGGSIAFSGRIRRKASGETTTSTTSMRPMPFRRSARFPPMAIFSTCLTRLPPVRKRWECA